MSMMNRISAPLLNSPLEDEPGMSLCICASGVEALEAAPRFLPDIVLLDVMIPGRTATHPCSTCSTCSTCG
jgi:CheY-like chemotaxis protein